MGQAGEETKSIRLSILELEVIVAGGSGGVMRSCVNDH